MTSLWAAGSAALASASITVRGLMLKPQAAGWCDAPPIVRVAITTTGATFGGVAISLFHSERVGLRETVAYEVVATSSIILLINMWRQRGQPCASEQQ